MAAARADEASERAPLRYVGEAGKRARTPGDGGSEVGDGPHGFAGNGSVPTVDTEGAGVAETEEGCETPARGGALGKGREDAGFARHGDAGAGDGGKAQRCPLELQPVDVATVGDWQVERSQHLTSRCDVKDLPEGADPQRVVGGVKRQTTRRLAPQRRNELATGRHSCRRELFDQLVAVKSVIFTHPQVVPIPSQPEGRETRIERETNTPVAGIDLPDPAPFAKNVSPPQESSIEGHVFPGRSRVERYESRSGII